MTAQTDVFFVLYLRDFTIWKEKIAKELAAAKNATDKAYWQGYLDALDAVLENGELNEYPEEWEKLNTMESLANYRKERC